MSNLVGYDTQIECSQHSGVWIVDPSPLCYLPVNNLPSTTVEIIQNPPPVSNSELYSQLQDIMTGSIRVMAPVYLMVWAAGIFARCIRARI